MQPQLTQFNPPPFSGSIALGEARAGSLAEFGKIFRRERQALRLTQSDVAQRLGCRRQTVADMEAGKSVTSLTLFNALGAIGKQVQVCALGIEADAVRALLGADWDE